MRGFALLTVTLVLTGTLVTDAGANGRIRATLTRSVPTNKSSGEHVVVAWKLRDSAGHLVSVKGVYVTIVCPTGDSYTTTMASPRADGTYRVSAVVPPGGIGSLTIGKGKLRFPITNPIRR